MTPTFSETSCLLHLRAFSNGNELMKDIGVKRTVQDDRLQTDRLA